MGQTKDRSKIVKLKLVRVAAFKVRDHRQAHLLRSSPNPIRTARSGTRGYKELSHAFQILGVRAFPVGLRLRIHAGRLNHAYRLLRIDYGPGYRIYFVQQGNTVVILLCGGDKRTQNKDIRTAEQMTKEV
jgi:hypothetical protein